MNSLITGLLVSGYGIYALKVAARAAFNVYRINRGGLEVVKMY
jgi:hypothetical protein